MNANQQHRMVDIEECRRNAFALSRTDRLGFIIKKSMELTQAVLRGGTNSKNLPREVESLERILNTTMNGDPDKDDMMRGMLYGMSTSLVAMFVHVIENTERRQEQPKIVKRAADTLLSQTSFSPVREMRKHANQGGRGREWDSPVDISFLDEPSPQFKQSDRKRKFPTAQHQKYSLPSRMERIPRVDVEEVIDVEEVVDSESMEDVETRVEDQQLLRCNICGKDWKTAARLERHLLTHTDDKPFGCEKCPFVFRTLTYLKEHLRNEHGEKPYECPECEMSFGFRKQLTEHNKEHLQCPQCGVLSRDRTRHENHLRTHTGEKPYACDRCDYSCAESGHLKRHLQAVHGSKPHQCPACRCKFAYHAELQMHIDRCHTEMSMFQST